MFKRGDDYNSLLLFAEGRVNSSLQILDACLAGAGLAQVTDLHAQQYLRSGALVEVLAQGSESFPGYHLYYPTRRQQTAAFRVVIDALRGGLDIQGE